MSIRSIGRTRIEQGGKKLKETKCDDFDDILEIIGSQGKFQKILLYGVLAPLTAAEPLFILNIIFMLFEPDHWCHVPGRDNLTDVETWKNLTIPMEVGPDGNSRYSQCLMYNSSGSSMQCQHGWEYDRTDYLETLPSFYNWVCDKSNFATDALTLAAAGNAIGCLFFGHAADKMGRRYVFFITLILNVIVRIISLFVAQSFNTFLALQFVIGTAFPVMYIAPCMIGAEISDKEYRAWIYSCTWMTWVFGMASLPLLAWLTRTWFFMGLVTSVPGILIFLYWFWVPESPRWLISRGRIQEAAVVIRRIAKVNGTSDKLSDQKLDSMLKTLVIQQDQCDRNVGVWTLFSSWRLAKNTILVTIAWAMNNLIYYGITLNATNLSGNQFVNFFILAIIEVPSGYFGGVLADKMGRRWTQVVFFMLCLVTCILAAIGSVHSHLHMLVIISIVIAKFAVTLTFLVVYMQAAEIFPTQLRTTGSGFASTVACATSIVAPYMIYLGKLNVSLPYMFLAVMSLAGMISSAFLPETLDQNLPETIEEAVKFGEGEKFWSFCPHSHKKENKEAKFTP
ncbi:unnamed protein product [Allacma fusca]|uniref:Major facilitator superfamily (MFS) profile domain-containing protein n=1 Tax=Allacma fusca TaxID=39272 RepID=A0A8J2LFR8_9HEXA|nr:unnamed protein product [Allacma fusca]